jgi:aspartate/methionine/tyrosine aminotransferase
LRVHLSPLQYPTVYDGYKHQSVASIPGLAERSFVVNSFGKTYAVTGWKMGYVMAPKNLRPLLAPARSFALPPLVSIIVRVPIMTGRILGWPLEHRHLS